MEGTAVPGILRERLGDDGALALVEMLHSAQQEWSERVLTRSDDRFGRAVADESGKLRLEIHNSAARVRQELDLFRSEVRQEFAAVRQEMNAGCAAVRQEVNAGFAAVRQEMSQCEVRLTREIAAIRFDVLKWVFLFWVAQLAATAGLLAFMLERVPR